MSGSIIRPMKSIITQFEATTIDAKNLIAAMGAVEGLEKLDTGKDISVKLESSCKNFAISNLRSANIVSKFVTDNCDDIHLVMRLLKNCEGLFKKTTKDESFPCYCSCGNCGASPLPYSCYCSCGRHGP